MTGIMQMFVGAKPAAGGAPPSVEYLVIAGGGAGAYGN